MGAIVLALALLGVARWRRQGKGQLAAVLILPMAVTLLASILHRYPFGGSRVDLFLVPAVLLLAAAGLSELAGRLPAPRRNWAWAAAAPLLISGASQATYHLFAPRCTSHLRPAVRFVQNHYQDGDTIVLAGSETPQIFYTYWPRPPCKVVILPDRQTVPLTGRFWCVCEFAPGEFAKKRKPTIDLESAGAAAIADESYLGRGGAAMLFVR
jgi:4-amino-4-deoxy-L-arabinose transferase-like glycosyltransferase